MDRLVPRNNLISYLPDFMKQFEEIKEIMAAEDKQMDRIDLNISMVLNNAFIDTADETGMRRYEKMLRINSDSTDTDDFRRLRIKLRLNRKTCYTYKVLKKELDAICPNGYYVNLTDDNTKIEVRLSLTSQKMLDEVRNMLEMVLPMDKYYTIDVLWNQHKTVAKFRHVDLKKYTHKQIREEVLK